MNKSFFLSILILLGSLNSYGGEGVYIAPQLGVSYGSGGEEAYSSLLGNNIGIDGGIKLNNMAIEFGIKRSLLSNSSIGSTDYDTEIKNDIYSAGVRIFTDSLINFKTGFVSHNFDMTIKEDEELEEDGSFTSIYFGSGINLSLAQTGMDFFWEGTLFPISDVDLYEIDLSIGLRVYM